MPPAPTTDNKYVIMGQSDYLGKRWGPESNLGMQLHTEKGASQYFSCVSGDSFVHGSSN